MASARKPTVKSNLRMGLFSRALARLSCNGDQSDALAYSGQEQGRRFRGQQCQDSPGTKKAPDDAGALYRWTLDEDSVPARHRATPVEAVDKLAADRVDPLLGVV